MPREPDTTYRPVKIHQLNIFINSSLCEAYYEKAINKFTYQTARACPFNLNSFVNFAPKETHHDKSLNCLSIALNLFVYILSIVHRVCYLWLGSFLQKKTSYSNLNVYTAFPSFCHIKCVPCTLIAFVFTQKKTTPLFPKLKRSFTWTSEIDFCLAWYINTEICIRLLAAATLHMLTLCLSGERWFNMHEMYIWLIWSFELWYKYNCCCKSQRSLYFPRENHIVYSINLNINYEQLIQSRCELANWIENLCGVLLARMWDVFIYHRWFIEWNKHRTIGNNIANWSEHCLHSKCNWRHIKYEWDSPQFTHLISLSLSNNSYFASNPLHFSTCHAQKSMIQLM